MFASWAIALLIIFSGLEFTFTTNAAVFSDSSAKEANPDRYLIQRTWHLPDADYHVNSLAHQFNRKKATWPLSPNHLNSDNLFRRVTKGAFKTPHGTTTFSSATPLTSREGRGTRHYDVPQIGKFSALK